MQEKAYNTRSSRRKVLKTIEAAAAGTTFAGSRFVQTASGATSANTPNDTYKDSMDIGLSRDQTGYHTSAVS